MAVAVYISNEKDSTEVAVSGRATKEIALVTHRYPSAVPVKIVGASIPGVQVVRIVSSWWVVQGETL